MARKVVAIGEKNRRIGEDHPKAKLTNRQVDEVFAMRDRGLSYARIAMRFNVSKACIRDILVYRTRSQWAVRFKTVEVKNNERVNA